MRLFAVGLASTAALAACSPLPGPSLDPMYFKVGGQPGAAPAQAGRPAAQAPPPAQEPPRVEARATATSVWTGRYQDSRGAGEATFFLVQGQSMVSGTWKLRTGGGGPLTGVVQAGGRRIEIRMENIAPECPAMFEGSAEISARALVGTYHGKDCEGPVTDGRLELHPRQP
jgi:hypothetical protein